MPAASATWRVQAPAASTTTGVRIDPRSVSTALTRPSSTTTRVTVVCGSSVAPVRLGTAREADRDLRRVEVEVVRQTEHREHPVGLEQRVQPPCLVRLDLLGVEAVTHDPRELGLEHVGVLGPARDLEAA